MIPSFNTISIREMHPLQVEGLMAVIYLTLDLASESSERATIFKAEATCDELLRLLGAQGIRVEFEEGVETSDDIS